MAVQLPANNEPSNASEHPSHHELPPFPTGRVSAPPERGLEGSNNGIGQLAELIASLKETIVQQNSIIANQNKIIEDIRSDRAKFQSEQQHLKDQIAELQETIGSLRAQLDTLSIEPPSTQTWASVAANGQPAGSSTTISRTTSTGTGDKDNLRQLVIDMSRVEEGIAEKVSLPRQPSRPSSKA